MIKTARTSHKWLMRFTGLQFILWALTGLYMVCMDIHFIHGESLTRAEAQTLPLSDIRFSLAELLQVYPDASNIELVTLLNQPVYRFRSASGQRRIHLISARSGLPQSEITANQASTIATAAYTGNGELVSVNPLISRDARGQLRPLWVVTFSDAASSTLYIEQQSGRIIRHRHNYWYLFDWMWRLHIMDYDDGENVANPLLLILSVAGLFAALSGALLLILRLTAHSVRSTS
ncbi:hypothetical protein [Alteromonas lipolytica]|uniref:PepSY domain-containing protein n=1 Tax=Alteromonas lipolytica TaxID=1856405 RepID=A0A1E8FFX6_9ALTE|nr:hypothetical protein [Alteromonas lipolytica]OFI34845.1 hypothetical protein BFC17_14825 [Alteromonas lipolytica]GGF54459.1 hypothetical protein GCM10011338_03320 [Alteromonas lipolytica]